MRAVRRPVKKSVAQDPGQAGDVVPGIADDRDVRMLLSVLWTTAADGDGWKRFAHWSAMPLSRRGDPSSPAVPLWYSPNV